MVTTMDRLSSVSRSRCMGDDPDFVQYVYDCAKAGVPVEEVRQSFKGERVYIPAHPHINRDKRAQIERDLRCEPSLSPDQIARKHGVGRRTVYRIRSELQQKSTAKPPRNI